MYILYIHIFIQITIKLAFLFTTYTHIYLQNYLYHRIMSVDN